MEHANIIHPIDMDHAVLCKPAYKADQIGAQYSPVFNECVEKMIVMHVPMHAAHNPATVIWNCLIKTFIVID